MNCVLDRAGSAGIPAGALRKPGSRRQGCRRSQAPDAPQVTAADEVGPLAHLDREVFGMFDGLAIHVANIERAVRASGEKHWTEPVIRRGEKFAALVRHA